MCTAKEKIIEAAKELFSQKGYAAVRTKEIANHAKVNETTLFRNFKSKKYLYEEVIIGNIKSVDTKRIFHKGLTGNVEKDLLSISNQLFMIYKANYPIIKMVMKGIIKDGDSFKDYSSECRCAHIKSHLVNYFKDLKSKNVINDDPELLAELYMSCMNGYLTSTFVLKDKEASLDTLIALTHKIIKTINFS